MSDTLTMKHWQLESDAEGIAWLTLDRVGEPVNSLGSEVLAELEQAVSLLEQATPKGVVFQSAKASGFLAGADVREFDQQTDIVAARDGVRKVHQLFNRIEALPCPTVAAIHGFCLGGGLELALACDYRVALDSDSTRIGFPEIQLGIFPGFGGTARSIRLLGGRQALTTILGARMYRAKPAKAAGLIDEIVGRHGSLRWAARNAVIKKRRSKPAGQLEQMSSLPGARHLLARVMEKEVAKKARQDHYPAPYAVIDLWRRVGGDFNALLNGEVMENTQLLFGDTSRNLRRVFRLQELLKAEGKPNDDTRDWQPRRVHVVGAGVMGGDIAAWCALRGMEVTLQDRELKYIEPALQRAEKLFRKRLKTDNRVNGARSRLRADVEGSGIARADVIIEAIFENLEAKQALFKTIEQQASPDAILASNTSALPLEDIAAGMENPERLIGLHFFNPVAMMPLVEIVRGEQSAAINVKKGSIFAAKIGKYPLPVKSSPGFLINRVLSPYMMTAPALAKQGYSTATIDAAAEAFGMPVGPVELADVVGLDICSNVADNLGGGNTEAIQQIQSLLQSGKLGKKSGEGFYRWEEGRAVKNQPDSNVDLTKLGQQLLQPMLDECQHCLDDGIVDNADLLDGGVIFGTGFAPFRGGPLNYLNQLNSSQTQDEVNKHE